MSHNKRMGLKKGNNDSKSDYLTVIRSTIHSSIHKFALGYITKEHRVSNKVFIDLQHSVKFYQG